MDCKKKKGTEKKNQLCWTKTGRWDVVSSVLHGPSAGGPTVLAQRLTHMLGPRCTVDRFDLCQNGRWSLQHHTPCFCSTLEWGRAGWNHWLCGRWSNICNWGGRGGEGEHSHAAKIWTRSFLGNILPWPLVDINSPCTWDFLQGKWYIFSRLSDDKDLSALFFFFISCKVVHFKSWAFSTATSHGCNPWWLQSGSSDQSWFGVLSVAVLSQVASLTAMAQCEIKHGMSSFVFCFVFCIIYLPLWMPVFLTLREKQEFPNLLLYLPLFCISLSFINFLLKTLLLLSDSQATSKHFGELFIPFLCQLSCDGVRRVVIVLQEAKMPSFSATAAVLLAVSTNHWEVPLKQQKTFLGWPYCFGEGNGTSVLYP